MLLESRKILQSHVGCSKASTSHVICVINTVALKGWAACGKQKKITPQDDRRLCQIAKSNRFSSVTQLSQLSQLFQSGVVLWGEKSLLQPPFVISRRFTTATDGKGKVVVSEDIVFKGNIGENGTSLAEVKLQTCNKTSA